MQIHFPAELEPFIDQEFASGRYATREDVVVQALRWLNHFEKALQPRSTNLARCSLAGARRYRHFSA